MTDMRLTEHLLLLVLLWRIYLERILKPKNILQGKQRGLSRSSTVRLERYWHIHNALGRAFDR